MNDESNTTPSDDTQWWDVAERLHDESPGPEDQAALERLRALAAGAAKPPHEAAARRGGDARTVRPLARRAAVPRLAAARGGERMAARIAAPAVFLVAVIVLVALMFQAGVIGGQSGVSSSPTPAASATKSGSPKPKSTTRVYVVKAGDTLSGIAVKFNTSVSVLEQLNPDMSTSTLVAGAKIRVPRN